jgi:hypothetical protein
MGISFYLPVAFYFPFFFVRDTAILSTKLGYGLPAFLARALAAVFCDGVKATDFLLGFLVSQTFLSLAMCVTIHHVIRC